MHGYTSNVSFQVTLQIASSIEYRTCHFVTISVINTGLGGKNRRQTRLIDRGPFTKMVLDGTEANLLLRKNLRPLEISMDAHAQLI